MKPPAFDYYRPTTLAEALSLIGTVEEAKVLAGGQSLVPMMNMRLARPGALVDINQVTELTEIQTLPDRLSIGALVRHYQLEQSPVVRKYTPIIAQAETLIGHPAIRSRGTIGGSLCHADPAAELPVLAVLGDWELTVQSSGQLRTIPAREFFLSFFITAIEPTELLTAVQVPKQTAAGQIVEYAVRSGDFALAIAAVTVDVDSSGTVRDARVALGGVADVPWRNSEMEQEWRGQQIGDNLWRDIAYAVSQAIDPADDLHATASHRRHLSKTLIQQAFKRAMKEHRTTTQLGRSH